MINAERSFPYIWQQLFIYHYALSKLLSIARPTIDGHSLQPFLKYKK